MLSLKGFLPANDKVRQVEFHPVLPWAVSATKSDHVNVWDWRTKQVIWSAQFGGTDEDLCADAELARLHMRDAAFAPNPSLMHPIPGAGAAKKEASGHVRDVRFLDCDVAQVQLTWQHNTAAGCGTPPPRAEEIKLLRGHRLLVIACDAKVIVVDLASHRVLELGKGVFEKQAPSALAFIFKGAHRSHGGAHHGAVWSPGGGGVLMESPVLAVGCADGVVRCLQLFPIKPVIRLVSAHKTPVVAMTIMAVRGQRHETLAVGHQGGRVVLYDPMSRSPGLTPDLGPRAEYKAHEKELLPGSLVVVPVEEDPESTRVLLFSAGSDNKLCGLDPSSVKGIATPQLVKIKAERTSLTCMAHWPRGWVSCGVHSLLLGTEGGHLLLASPATGSVRQAADLDGMVPAGQKRNPKVYGVFVHPMMPGLVAAATNTGTAVLAVTAQPQSLPVAPLPLTAPSQALHDDGAAAMGAAFGGSGGGGATYVAAMGKQVLCVTASTLPNQDMSEYPPNQVMGKLQVAKDTPSSRALVTVSHDGSYVAVAWPGARQYAVYRQGASAWQEVTRGTGTSVAWHSSRPAFAALEEDVLSTAGAAALAAAGAAGGKPSKDLRKAEKQAEAARVAMEAASKAAAATAAVRLREMQGSGGAVGVRPLIAGALDLRGDLPAYVQGGPLLAVTLRRGMQAETPDLAPAGGSAPAMWFFDWEGGRRVGPELPEPLLLSWDPSRTMVALAYPSQLLVVRARPDFQVISTLPIGGAESLEWASRQLFISTPTHILLALLAPGPPALPATATSPTSPEPPPPARLIALAVPNVGVSAAAVGAVTLEGLLPPPATRPPGPLVLLGPRDGCLWFVGALGQPAALSLTHPGLRCCCLVASGDLQGAVTLATRTLAPELHDSLAALMLEMEGLRGAAAAAALPGISLQIELRLRALLRHWQQAVEAAEALLLGYTRRPPPGAQFRSAVAAAAFGAGRGAGGLYGSDFGAGTAGGGGAQLGEEFVDLSMAAGGPPATAPAHPEDLDWTQPLRAAGSSAKAAAAALVASGEASQQLRGPERGGKSVGPLGGVPSPATVQLVLGLLEDLERAAMYDVVRHLAKLLLVHAVQLSGQQLRTLAGTMAQAGMKTDLPGLAHSVAAGADSSSREAAGLMAALLSGHTTLVQDDLREDGAAALAALQARVYGLSAAADSMAAWRRQLAAAAPAGAAATLGRLGVTVPA